MATQKSLTTQTVVNLTDKTKGQKIVAAIYLISNHLSDSDPMKIALRQNAVALVAPSSDKQSTALHLIDLLQSSSLAGLVSQTNATILLTQIEAFHSSFSQSETPTFETLFDTIGDGYLSDRFQSIKDNNLSYKNVRNTQPLSVEKKSDSKPTKTPTLSQSELKSKRREQILSFIEARKSAGIKDISALFPEVSEKTIQREVSSLVEKGEINKRGNKRWSIYMSVIK